MQYPVLTSGQRSYNQNFDCQYLGSRAFRPAGPNVRIAKFTNLYFLTFFFVGTTLLKTKWWSSRFFSCQKGRL